MTSPPTRSAEISRNADPTPSPRRSEESISLGWLDALTRHRKIAFTLLVLVYLAAFNGIWRIGVDSALYRGLARSIARDGTYMFAGERHTHAFAGLPVMLAGLEKLFGESPVPALIMITLMALATLWLVDATLRLRYPLWVATIITLGVGLNYRFVRQSQELMTDIPFTLGVMMSLYAYERLRHTIDRNALLRMILLLLGGLMLAAATRPTFGVLVGAMIIVSAYAAITNAGGKRTLHLGIILAAAAIAILLVLLDPRTTISAPFDGKYEIELREAVKELPVTILGQLKQFLGSNLNDAFFSQELTPFAIPFSILVLVGAGLVFRRNMMWGLMIFGLVLVTLPLSTVPRYYLMVMPMLWLGWILLLSKATLRSPRILQGAVMMIGVGLPLILNFGRTLGFIVEQRHGDWITLTTGVNRHDAFYSTYRNGAIAPLLKASQLIATNTTPSDKIIGPSAHVLAYFAGRRVVSERTIFFEKSLSTYPNVLQKYGPDYVVGPTKLYEDTDPTIRDLIRRRILIPMRKVASVGEDAGVVYLSTAVVRPPPESVKWTNYVGDAEVIATTRISAVERAEILRKKARKLELEKRARKEKREKIERQERLERREKIERREKLERKAKLERRLRLEKQQKIEARQRREARERRERKTSTQPATMPSTVPVTTMDFPLIHRPAWLETIA